MASKKRLIDANALLEEHCGGCSLEQRKMCENDPVCGSAMWIVEAPTVDAVPVVHGRWDYGVCTACGFDIRCIIDVESYFEDWVWNEGFDYCPNCGAVMDGGDEDV